MTSSPRITFNHIGLYVCDLPRMERFYRGPLGFSKTDEGLLYGKRFVFLSRSPDDHHQIVLAEGRADLQTPTILNQLSFRAETLSDLRSFKFELEKDGVESFDSVTHGNAWSLYFHDPEQNRLEAFVDAPWYIKQPFRKPFDLSLPDQQIIEQTKEMCRADPSFRSRADWRREMAEMMGLSNTKQQ